MCVVAAITGSAAVGLAGSAISASGAQSAANTQASAQEQAASDQMQMFNTINGQEQPFMQAGYGATTGLQQLLGLSSGTSNTGGLANGFLTQTFNPSSITSSPGYQFAQKQGLSAVANNEAPLVGAMSGPSLKALTNFSTGTAEQYYNDYFNQFQSQQNNIFNRLSGLAGIGQNAASNVGNAGTQLGTGAAQATAAAGASQAAGTVGAANAISTGLSGASNALLLSQFLGGNGSAGVPGWTPATGGT